MKRVMKGKYVGKGDERPDRREPLKIRRKQLVQLGIADSRDEYCISSIKTKKRGESGG